MTVAHEKLTETTVSGEVVTGSKTVGDVFAKAREQRNMTLEEVSIQLKFGANQLRALEQSDWAYFSKPVLLKGLIRNYAKFLAIDPEPILSAIEPVLATNIDVLEPLGRLETPLPRTGFLVSIGHSWISTRWLLMIVGMAVIVIAGLWFSSWGFKNSNDAPEQAPDLETVSDQAKANAPPNAVAPSRTEPNVRVSEAAAPVRATALSRLELQAKGRSWVELRGPGKNVLFSKTLLAGQSHQMDAEVGSNLVIGNVHVVTVIWNDKVLDLIPTERGSVARLTLN